MDKEIIEKFKYVKSDEAPVFNFYVMRKAQGVILDLESLSPADLQEMFIDENMPDSAIASLFNTDKDNVRKKKYKHDIKFGQTFSKKLMQRLEKIVDSSFVEKPQCIEHVLMPIKIMFNPEDDLIFAPYRVLENDGRPYPFYDQEGLQEVDTEAFCIRISRVKKEIRELLSEIISFLGDYEWNNEVEFEWKDEKVTISAVLYTEEETKSDKISLAVYLQISGSHPLGDLILDSGYDLHNNMLRIITDDCDFETDAEKIHEIFMDSWDEVRNFVQTQKRNRTEYEE